MKIKDLYIDKNDKKLPISFEIFPPKDDFDKKKLENLFEQLEILKKYNPSLVSVTYGAGGSNKDTSFEIVKYLVGMKVNVMPHFTCICTQKSKIDEQLEELKSMNIENILALRGDEPNECEICYRDFRYANELVEYLKISTDFSIGVAGYPEGHIDAPDLNTDIQNLKKKIDAGGDVIYTQLFFDNSKMYKYIELLRTNNITKPVVAGILPIISYTQLDRMLSLAKVTVPKKLLEQIEKYKDNSDDIKKLGIDYATEQCSDLIGNGIQGIHFYTLNKAYSTSHILDNLNI